MTKKAQSNGQAAWRNRITGYGSVDPEELLANPLNYRIHPKAQQDALAGTLNQIGWIQDVIVNAATGFVLDGHLRVALALRTHQPEIPVKYVELTPEEEALALATLDPLTSMAGTDAAKLDELLQQVQTDEAAIQEMLAGLAESAGLHAPKDEPSDAKAQIDRAEELRQEWGVEPGQLWRLPSRTPGQEHRLICGDCTEVAVVERVMGGEKARLLMTSPPYWVGKDYEQEQTWAAVQAFIERASSVFAEATSHRIVINSGAPPAARLTGERAHIRLLIDDWQRELARHGLLMRYIRIWAKRGGLVHTAPISDCIDQHWEFIATFYRPETYEGQRRLGERWATDGIWDDLPGEMSSHGHIAAFPIEIPERNIRLYTDEGHVVLEPFLGSGTTLIACENLSRQCRAVELSPGYCAVALERYFQAFGIRAELVG